MIGALGFNSVCACVCVCLYVCVCICVCVCLLCVLQWFPMVAEKRKKKSARRLSQNTAN